MVVSGPTEIEKVGGRFTVIVSMLPHCPLRSLVTMYWVVNGGSAIGSGQVVQLNCPVVPGGMADQVKDVPPEAFNCTESPKQTETSGPAVVPWITSILNA